MNINNVSTEGIEIPKGEDVIGAMFAHQFNLMQKYGPIETKNGHYYPPVNPGMQGLPPIDGTHFQLFLKGCMWRVHEELSEAAEVYYEKEAFKTDDHFLEEISDALHFLIELSWFCVDEEFTPRHVAFAMGNAFGTYETKEFSSAGITMSYMTGVMVFLGLTGNVLKNKPWKTSHMRTDKRRLTDCLIRVWGQFFLMIRSIGLDESGMYKLYFRKMKVNEFRQASNY